ncbi:MAG: efflux RND transporter periplasmic adaptor subunit [Pseudomonadota bacterium]
MRVHSFAIAATIALLSSCADSDDAPPPPPSVTISVPEARQIVDWDEYTGQFEAIEAVEVRARVEGYLQQTHFVEGAFVNRGDLLFTIDPRPFEAALARAKATLAGAKTRRDLARADLARGETLLAETAMSEEEYDARVQGSREAETAVVAAEADVREAELDLGFTRVRAPISGRVGQREVTPGNLVSGGGPNSTLLTTLFSLDPIDFTFTADEAAYLKYVRQNAEGSRPSSREVQNPVRLKLQDDPGFIHGGRMIYVDNQIDVNTDTILGKARFANPDALFVPGMFGRMQLLGSGEYEAILVPDSAILTDQSSKIVMTVDEENMVVPVPVELGNLQPDGMRVVTGLAPDARVITAGLARARPGQPVTVGADEEEDSDLQAEDRDDAPDAAPGDAAGDDAAAPDASAG